MRVDKVILRAALSTLAAIAALFAVMMLALCFIFPATMMRITYDLGMDSASIYYAKRAYDYTGEAYYAAFATETAIGAENYANVETCGEAFIADDEFDAYCQQRNAEIESKGGYEQYVYGQVCVAKYRLGEKAEAIEKAFALVGEAFPENNAIAAVLLTALSDGDSETANAVMEKMNEMDISAFSNTDKTYYEAIRGLFQNG
ncbi:MAG: hypothetical protein IJX96_05855 [Clostridia bacterium]|nr:hypothetical protein [Clostridia bacterium]